MLNGKLYTCDMSAVLATYSAVWFIVHQAPIMDSIIIIALLSRQVQPKNRTTTKNTTQIDQCLCEAIKRKVVNEFGSTEGCSSFVDIWAMFELIYQIVTTVTNAGANMSWNSSTWLWSNSVSRPINRSIYKVQRIKKTKDEDILNYTFSTHYKGFLLVVSDEYYYLLQQYRGTIWFCVK